MKNVQMKMFYKKHFFFFFAEKMKNVQMNFFFIFLISTQNIDCGYTLDSLNEAVQTSSHNLCFTAEIRKK